MVPKKLLDGGLPRSRPSALLLDLDGTLLNSEDVYSLKSAEAISAVSEMIPVSLASGRFGREVGRFARKLNLKHPQIAENGARIIDPQTGESLYQNDLGRDEILAIVVSISRSGYRFYASEEGRPVSKISNLKTWRVSIISVCAGGYESALRLSKKAEEFENIAASMSISSLGEWYVMFTKSGVDKGRATEVFAKMIKLNTDEIMAIGDGPNDVEMFNAVGFPVAMGHASQEVKSSARFVTENLDNEGLAVAIEKLILTHQRGE